MTIKWTGKTITGLSLYKRRATFLDCGYGVEHLPFLFLYSIVLYYCYNTIGEPYAKALLELQEQGIDIASKMAPVEDVGLAASALSSGIIREDVSPVPLSVDDDGPPLPNAFLPGLVPLLCLLATVLCHILLFLFQVWFVGFLAFIKYTPVNDVYKAEYVKIIPRRFRGKSMMVPVEKLHDNPETLYFFFQKKKYMYDVETKAFSKVKAPVNYPLSFYSSNRGFKSHRDFKTSLELYGKNEFHISQPTFTDMFKQQLLEPLTVFQLFSVVLWILDEYWQYPLFMLVMIIMFEGVTVMSRLKNLNTLRGMGNEETTIHVYRCGSWQEVSSTMIIPGDVFSLTRGKNGKNAIPCDALLLQGSAVCNEATLTGESVPQMKEAIPNNMSDEDGKVLLDMKSLHKVHILYGGTTMMQHTSITTQDETKFTDTLVTPDGGCLVYALRSGFSASQGKLVRMIEFSSEKVSSSTWDALGLALLLLIFALISSSYVLTEGIKKKGHVTFELLLRCVLIITSVIPTELPMQTSLAVNSALLALVKLSIFCTEPFRISLAGKVDICLFDKTGTITTDQLTAVGVASWDPSNPNENTEIQGVEPMIASPIDTTLVLAGCHSLVEIEGKLVGDPVEEASIRAVDFTYDSKLRRSTPKPSSDKSILRDWPSGTETGRVAIDILHRNHFASKLQRMSVIVRVNTGIGKTHLRSLVKGSPEAIGNLLGKSKECQPNWYWQTYRDMARKGMRVLALAYKELEPGLTEADIAKKPRSWAESDLKFVGFAAFQCLVRKDSRDILGQLMASSHRVTMITGDAVLTAIHVACEVNITSRAVLILTETEKDELHWTSAKDDSFVAAYDASTIQKLEKEYDLCVSGKSLSKASEQDDLVWKQLPFIRVFARMTPELKERVMTSLKKNGHHTLMCGDGANDVGALRQAHVGVALLSGFGSANVDKGKIKGIGENTLSNSKLHKKQISSGSKEDLMKLHASVLRKRLTALGVDSSKCTEKKDLVELLRAHGSFDGERITSPAVSTAKPIVKPPQAGLTAEEKREILLKKQAEIEADVREREARGESFARVKAMVAFAKRESEEARRKAKENSGSKGFAAYANNATLQQYMEDFEDGELPMVKLGDASTASPFTSRAPSIKACVDIIRQGRCAHVTTMQMYQILAVNCLISSYSLSVLYLDRVKYGNQQMVALGVISSVSSITLSRASPLQELSPVRPLTSVFHPALFFSLIGQFAIHLWCMVYTTNLAKSFIPEGDDTHKQAGEFTPNLMSTVVFLINSVQTVSVCAVNYKGRPFMKGMADNPGLLYSLGASIIGVFLSSTEIMPLFNKLLQIVPLPDKSFGKMLTLLLLLDVLGAFVWDQICLFVFAPQIFLASIKAMSGQDIKKFGKMGVIIMILIYILSNTDFDEIAAAAEIAEKGETATTN